VCRDYTQVYMSGTGSLRVRSIGMTDLEAKCVEITHKYICREQVH
jgi:hypothetical protein